MKSTLPRLRETMEMVERYFTAQPDTILNHKPTSEKWSKKEILGHLIDSAINNIKRFTDCQISQRSYQMVEYRQAELVAVNEYQTADASELLNLWLALNRRIGAIMKNQTETSLSTPLVLSDGTPSDLKFLMTDYVDHLEHHVKQILG